MGVSSKKIKRGLINIQQIETLIKQGESVNREFKTSTNQLKAAIETTCAYLNGKGGVVLIGVKNNGQIIGQDVSDNTRQDIAREIKKIEPDPQIEVDYIPVNNGKFVIVLETAFGYHAPYVYDRKAYERVESTTGHMSQHRYRAASYTSRSVKSCLGRAACSWYDLDSLDHDEIRRTISEGVYQNRIGTEMLNSDIEHVLSKLKLFKNGKLINAALVLYAKDVQSRYSNCKIRMARYRGNDKLGDFIDNIQVYGNAFHLIAAGLDFAQRHLPIAGFFEPGKVQRTDQPAVPALALREALINAISHREYVNRSASLALEIFDDRLELWNNGTLPPELKIDDLNKPHQSYPRNEIIASIFYKRKWVESLGTGTLRMIGYCKENGTPEPEFIEYSGGFAIVFKFKEPMDTAPRLSAHRLSQYELKPRQQNVLKILSSGQKMSLSEISELLEDAPALRTVGDDLALLKEIGLISLTGRARTAKWFIVKK